jgi:hypothetical protein
VRLFWCSNSPLAGSGYGVQSALFAPRIRDAGHHVGFYANWGIQGACIDWDGMRVYPSDGEWGNRTLIACSQHFSDGEPVQIVALCDAWVMSTDNWRDDMQIALWAPVDHWPLPPPSRKVLSHAAVTPIAMSRFGERMMQDAGLDPLYVPHGVDTTVFRPRPEDRDGVRSETNMPKDAFVVGMVAANQGSPQMHRKAFPQQFKAFARFRETHKDAVLYVHTNEYASQGGSSGLMLRQLAEACGLPRHSVLFTEVFAWELGLSRDAVAALYSGFDVFMNCAMGEGFGVPIVEAQACGVPVIVTDHSAMTELSGAGWVVGGEDWYDGPQDAWLKSPSVDEIVFALDEAYERATDPVLKTQAVTFAAGYDADTVMAEHWLPALEALEAAAMPAEAQLV